MESALERFVNLEKPDFLGRQALLSEIKRGPEKLFVSLVVDCELAPAHSGDSVYHDANLVGTVTSGGYGHRVQKNIAFAFIKPELAATGTQLEIEILGEKYHAMVTDPGLYDPENKRVRV